MVPEREISDLCSLWCQKECGVAGGTGLCGLGGVGYLGKLGESNHRDSWWLTKWEREGTSGCTETQKVKGARWLCGAEN